MYTDVGTAPSSVDGCGEADRAVRDTVGRCVIGCLSMHKTSSSALTAALRGAGFHDAVQSHAVGPRSTALLRNHLAAAGPGATELNADMADAASRVILVTCVRDPIAQMISTYFQFAATQRRRFGHHVPLTGPAFTAWCDRLPADYPTWWFDDNLGTVLDFDFRTHPFDALRGSLRFASPHLRLLCLRVEDAAAVKEAELGWLVGQESVSLPHLNVTAEKANAEAYETFKTTFAVPERWVDHLFGGDLVRHFYTREERESLASHWLRPRERPGAHAGSVVRRPPSA